MNSIESITDKEIEEITLDSFTIFSDALKSKEIQEKEPNG